MTSSAGTVVVAVLPQTPVPVCETLRIPGGPRLPTLLILSLPSGALPVCAVHDPAEKPFVALMYVPAPLCNVLGSGSGWQGYGTGIRG
jgi:hypothetical protein